MKRKLRHPIRSITEPYGKAGLLVAILALVLATTGAAFAAVGLNGKQKKEVTAIAKKFAGKPGAPGATGPAGPAGPAGANGEKGEKGATGNNGANGKSVVTTANAAACNGLGGVEVEVAGEPSTKKTVCNGEEGQKGQQGEPWTAGGTLPTGATETGTWAVTAIPVGYENHNSVLTPISFPIPLAAPLTAEHAHVIAAQVKSGTGTGNLTNESKIVANVNTASGEFTQYSYVTGSGIPANTIIQKVISSTELELSNEATTTAAGVSLQAGLPTGCKGNRDAPEAESGNLCIFESRNREETYEFVSNVKEGLVRKPFESSAVFGAGRFGALLWLWSAESGQRIDQFGTWAVTG